MTARKLVPLGLLVAVLLAVAGVASHGRPLAGGRGSGPTATFFDYVATTLLLLAIVFLAVAVYAVFSQRTAGSAPPRSRWYLLSSVLAFFVTLAAVAIILHSGFIDRVRRLEQQAAHRRQTQPPSPSAPVSSRNRRNARVRWDEVAVFLALVAATGIVALASRRTKGTPRPWLFGRKEEVAQALDDSIDDLRADPDLRRAIIAAYARMEYALARAGLPRHPSEAPFEYMERALLTLDASAESAERLTELFEWAKFSHHDPQPDMRDDAIEALVAVRDELAREPVTA